MKTTKTKKPARETVPAIPVPTTPVPDHIRRAAKTRSVALSFRDLEQLCDALSAAGSTALAARDFIITKSGPGNVDTMLRLIRTEERLRHIRRDLNQRWSAVEKAQERANDLCIAALASDTVLAALQKDRLLVEHPRLRAYVLRKCRDYINGVRIRGGRTPGHRVVATAVLARIDVKKWLNLKAPVCNECGGAGWHNDGGTFSAPEKCGVCRGKGYAFSKP